MKVRNIFQDNEVKIELAYTSYSKGVIVHLLLAPYFIKESQGRWYLVAVNEKGTIWQYCLDRFLNLKITTTKFKKTASLEIEKRYKGSYGVIGGDEYPIETIILNFSPFQAQYERGYPIHSSQEEIGSVEGGYIQFRYQMRVTRDLEMKILSYGKTVQVIEPMALRSSLKIEIGQMLNQYN